MIDFKYLLSGVGYISKDNVKDIIRNINVKFSGFQRYQDTQLGASAIIVFNGKTHLLDVQHFKKVDSYYK